MQIAATTSLGLGSALANANYPNVLFTFSGSPYFVPNLYGFNFQALPRLSRILAPVTNFPVCGVTQDNPSNCYWNYHYASNGTEVFGTAYYDGAPGNAIIYSVLLTATQLTAGPVYLQRNPSGAVTSNEITAIENSLGACLLAYLTSPNANYVYNAVNFVSFFNAYEALSDTKLYASCYSLNIDPLSSVEAVMGLVVKGDHVWHFGLVPPNALGQINGAFFLNSWTEVDGWIAAIKDPHMLLRNKAVNMYFSAIGASGNN